MADKNGWESFGAVAARLGAHGLRERLNGCCATAKRVVERDALTGSGSMDNQSEKNRTTPERSVPLSKAEGRNSRWLVSKNTITAKRSVAH